MRPGGPDAPKAGSIRSRPKAEEPDREQQNQTRSSSSDTRPGALDPGRELQINLPGECSRGGRIRQTPTRQTETDAERRTDETEADEAHTDQANTCTAMTTHTVVGADTRIGPTPRYTSLSPHTTRIRLTPRSHAPTHEACACAARTHTHTHTHGGRRPCCCTGSVARSI